MSSLWISISIFVITIFVIWGLGSVRAHRGREKRQGRRDFFRPAGFVVGNDNRLSLSRLQAFVWSMAIFGTYAAAWRGHTPVWSHATDRASITADSVAKHARDEAVLAHTNAVQAEIQTQIVAHRVRDEQARIASLANSPGADSTLKTLRAQSSAVMSAAREAGTQASAAALAAEELETDAARVQWVAIPAVLLALAGVSIGSGVIATLISSGTSSGVRPCVLSLAAEQYATLRVRYPKLGVPRNPNVTCVVINGTGLGNIGRVRFNTDFADILFWADDGTTIVIVPPAEADRKERTLVVDTANGKVAYGAMGAMTTFDSSVPRVELGSATDYLEWSDLFRSDSDPTNVDLMKFQMFGWTLIAVSLYLWSFFSVVARQSAIVASLPPIDPSLVALTGVSQLAYLTNKGAQSTKAASDRDASAANSALGAAAPIDGIDPNDRSVPPGLIPPLHTDAPTPSLR
jgi:hypothetical protein